jgi:hypothetical protein
MKRGKENMYNFTQSRAGAAFSTSSSAVTNSLNSNDQTHTQFPFKRLSVVSLWKIKKNKWKKKEKSFSRSLFALVGYYTETMPHTFEYVSGPTKHKKERRYPLFVLCISEREMRRRRDREKVPWNHSSRVQFHLPCHPPAAHDTHRGSISIPFRWLEKVKSKK